MAVIMITGANRGLGLEFVRQYAAEDNRILACCRDPEKAEELKKIEGNISIHALDVTNQEQIDALAAELAGTAVDILINNAGIYGPRDAPYDGVDAARWAEVVNVNTMAPLAVANAFLPNLDAGEQKILAFITSKMGSIEDNTSGGSYIYRTSKAALNMVGKGLAMDLKPRGIRVLLLHPGWVKTDMGGPNALIDAGTSILGMRTILANLHDDQSGMFFNFDGSMIPW